MRSLIRDPSRAAEQTHDLVVIGGGIHGVMVFHEAVRRGLSCLLLERGDFGEATTQNNFRILHGGLRYLQAMNFSRFYASVAERRWFLRQFPDLTEPLPCLMPLHNRGLRRRAVFGPALLVNDLLSLGRNRGVRADRLLAAGKLLSEEQALSRFPFVHTSGLVGAALWHDACMPWPQRIVIETLRHGCANGKGQALNYCCAKDLQVRAGRLSAVVAEDRVSGELRQFRARAVVNAAGPWSPAMAEQFGMACPSLYPPTLAWNLLFSRPAPFTGAVAVTAPHDGAATLFLLSWQGRLLAGTAHAPWRSGLENVQPDENQNKVFVNALNAAAPGLDLRVDEIERVYAGLLPGRSDNDHRVRENAMLVHHDDNGGTQGVWSMSGVKFTTARRVAENLLKRMYPRLRPMRNFPSRAVPAQPRGVFAQDWWSRQPDVLPGGELRRLVAEEAVMHLDDLVLRRTNLGDQPAQALSMAPTLCNLLGWSSSRSRMEVQRLGRALRGAEGVQSSSGVDCAMSPP